MGACSGERPAGLPGGSGPVKNEGITLRGSGAHGSVRRFSMRVHLHPQRRTVDIEGRRRVGQLLRELGVLPGTAMVIRGDVLLTDGEVVEDGEEIEVRAVISGGSGA
jgi:sulfur carrier protein